MNAHDAPGAALVAEIGALYGSYGRLGAGSSSNAGRAKALRAPRGRGARPEPVRPPPDDGLRVRTAPGGLLVTSPNLSRPVLARTRAELAAAVLRAVAATTTEE